MNRKQFNRRIWGVVMVLVSLLTFLCSNLYTLQYTMGAEYATQSVAKVAETEVVPASRGLILDRNGTVLVSNEVSYQVSLNTSQMGDSSERCANLLSLIEVARQEGVVWADTLSISTTPPFTYTTDDPFFTVSTDEEGNEVKKLTKLGSLAVNMKWINDPTKEPEPVEEPEPEEPSWWENLMISLGFAEEEPVNQASEDDPNRLPTAEELLGRMCKSFGIQGTGAVDEDEAKKEGKTVPTLNLGDMSQVDARAVAGVLYELYYRSKINNWPLYVFAEDVSTNFITSVKEHGLRGVEIEAVTVRKYNTQYAAHLLGRVASMSPEEADYYMGLDVGYNLNDKVGKEGAEWAFEQYLRGTSGTRTIERNENGKIISSNWLTDTETGELMAPEPGNNVFLTIDIDLQQKVEEILATGVKNLESKEVRGAACVVLDVDTGEILTSASYPTFSLENYSRDYAENATDPLSPLLNRAFMGLYAPGSTFKMITAIAALEEGLVTPNTKIRDEGKYTYWSKTNAPQCWIYRQYGSTHGLVDVTEAIEVSCNYFFYDVGRRMGIETLDRYAEMFGLGQKTGVELSEYPGVLASPEYSESVGQKWYEGNITSVAIGQENTQVTPIQLANYIATLVNGGTRYTTHLLKTVKSGDFSQVVYNYEPQVVNSIQIKEENLDAVKEGMLDLTTEGSVAYAFADLPFQVGAKTGSAQVSVESQSNAVFVCFAPYDDPQVAVALVVERGGSGSTLGEMAAQVLTYYFTTEGNQGQLPVENVLLP